MHAPGFIRHDVCKQTTVAQTLADGLNKYVNVGFRTSKVLDSPHLNYYVDAGTRCAKNLTN